MTNAPVTITFASVVLHETVHVALMLSWLNKLQVKVSDIENTYITAPFMRTSWYMLTTFWSYTKLLRMFSSSTLR